MKIWRWAVGGLVAVAAAVGVACNLDDSSEATSSSPLIKWSTTELWDGGVVQKICFVNGSPQQWEWLRNAVEESWGNSANVRFVGWKACDFNDHTPVVSVGISPTDTNPGGSNTKNPLGEPGVRDPNAWNDAANTYDPQIWLAFGDPDASNMGRQLFEAVGVHEFGHELGFDHEQDQDAALTAPDGEGCTPDRPSDDAGNPIYDDAGNVVYYTFPDQDLTPYDPDSIMNYCHTGSREYSARLSEYDVQGLQSAYGASTRTNGNGEVDSDGDGWADYRDNCPYSKNDQTDSNFDAELTLAKQDPNWSTDDGHRPIATDSQAYKDHWHDKYKGDACDPTVSTRVDNGNYTSWLHSTGCLIRYVGGVTASSYDPNQTCPYTFNTGLSFTSFVGGPAGFSQSQHASSAPAFCACDQMFGAEQSQCADPLGSYKCVYADDPLFPPLNGGLAPGSWHAIQTEGHVYLTDFIHGNVQTTHVNVEPWIAPPPYASNWDLIADLPNYGLAAPGSNCGSDGSLCVHDDLLGSLWSHVNTTYPYSIINRPDPTNLENSYTPMDGQWQFGEIIHWVAPFGRQWWRIPYCNPLNSLQHVKYRQIAYGVSGSNNGDAYAIAQDETGVYEFTRSLTPAAMALLAYVSNGTAEVLVADDRVGGWPTDGVNPNAIVVNTGTTSLLGAFTTSGTKMDAQFASVAQTTTSLRSYAASTGKLYSLEYARGWKLNARDVPTMLTGVASNVVKAVTGSIPTSPRAIVWNAATSRLIVLDWLTTAERLLSIDSNGVSTELWRTETFSGSALPSSALSATNVGEIVLSQWAMGDNLVHVLVMRSDGRPESSTTIAGSAQSAVVANSSGLTVPLVQTVNDTAPNMGASYVDRSALDIGVCGSSWFKTIANNGAANGALADGPTCPGQLTNGGFESGTFLGWTAAGQSETISTSAHSGSYGAMLGATTPTNGDSTVQQTFVVPASGGTLSFWYSNVCPDTVTFDWFTASLLDGNGALLATIVPRTCASSSSWTQATLSLSSWAGQTVKLVLTSHDDNYPGDATYSFVDDVALQ